MFLHTLKLRQSTYHLIWTPRSKENEFQKSLFQEGPFEINMFIFFYFAKVFTQLL
eukprot:UN17460